MIKCVSKKIFPTFITGNRNVKEIFVGSRKITSFETIHIYSGAKFQDADWPGRVCYVFHWLCEAVYSGEFSPLQNYFTDEAWLYFNGHKNTQNSSYWSVTNRRVPCEVPVYHFKFWVWHAISRLHQECSGPCSFRAKFRKLQWTNYPTIW